jgi:putative FmdB family regulatory protein
MPLYPFRCTDCGAEFEVSRKMSESSKPANCPVDGAAGTRIFTAPVTLSSGRGESSAPAEKKDGPDAAAPKPQGYSHFGHSHGFGVGGHSHGPPPGRPS